MTHEELENVNKSITSKEIESAIKNFTAKKSPEPDSFTGEFSQTLNESMPIIFKLFQKIGEEGTLPNSFTMPALP